MKIKASVLSVGAAIGLVPCSQAQLPFASVNWVGLGPTNAALNGTVYALTTDSNGNPFAGGMFTAGGTVQLPWTGIWDGSKWSAAGSGLPLFNSSWTYAFPQLASGGGFVYGLGSVVTNASVSGVARWNGSSWSNLTTNPGGNGPVFGANLYTYAPLPYGTGPFPMAVAADASGFLYVGGYFAGVDGVPAQNIAKWNGTNWKSLGSGCEGPVTVLATDLLGNVYAGGYFAYAGDVLANNIAKWDGTNWSALGSGINSTASDTLSSVVNIKAISCDNVGRVYVAGTFTNAGGIAANRIARWDGTNWSALGSGLGFTNAINDAVYALATDDTGNLYAGGRFGLAGGVQATNIARWDGTNWTTAGSLGSYGGYGVFSLNYDHNGHLYAGGNFSKAGTNTVYYVAEAIIGTATNPPTLTISNAVAGGIGLSWPLDHTGWRLQAQRNPAGGGIASNWFTIPGSTNVNATNFPVNPGAGSVFYRLVYP